VTQVEALRYLLDRGYILDIGTGYLKSPHGDGLYTDDKEKEALELLCGLNK
jgi:hypothetical protein